MQIEKISPSSHNVYEFCEWQWFLQYEARFINPAGASALLGKIAHKTLEIISNTSKCNKVGVREFLDKDTKTTFFNTKDVDNIFDVCYKHFISLDKENGAKVEKDKSKTKKVLEGVKWLLGEPESPDKNTSIMIEDKFFLPFEGPEWVTGRDASGKPQYFLLNGVIDRVDDLGGGNYRVVDYKTGKSNFFPPKKDRHSQQKTLEDFYFDVQAISYFTYTKSRFPQAKSILVTFLYISEKKKFTMCFGEHDIERLKEKILKTYIEIKKNNNPQKNVGWHCKKLCHFGKEGICQKAYKMRQDFGLDFTKKVYLTINNKKREDADAILKAKQLVLATPAV